MFPFNDTEENRYIRFPYMTVFLIAVNIFITALIMRDPEAIFAMFGTTPRLIWLQEGGVAVTAVSHMFLHGGLIHLLGNMLALWVFGRRIEDLTGPWRFLAFYLICGLTANIINSIVHANSAVSAIGASGAIYGVMAAYLILFPKGRIHVLFIYWFLPIFNVPLINTIWFIISLIAMGIYVVLSEKNLVKSLINLYTPTLKAYLVILYFVLSEIPRALQVLVYDYETSIGHWAHLGGFFGGLFIFFFLRSDAFHRYRNELPL